MSGRPVFHRLHAAGHSVRTSVSKPTYTLATRPPTRPRKIPRRPGVPFRKYASSGPNEPPPNPRPQNETGGSTASTTTSRLTRLLSRLPKPLRPYAARLRSAPLSHATAFLLLHEITAIVPLLGLFGVFHLTDLHVAPVRWVAERYGDSVQDGLGRFERYFRRKGWFGFSESAAAAPDDTRAQGGGVPGPAESQGGGGGDSGGGGSGEDVLAGLQGAQGPYKVVVEVALAYAITKALLPLRIAVSLWATPWFAGVLVRARGLFRRGR